MYIHSILKYSGQFLIHCGYLLNLFNFRKEVQISKTSSVDIDEVYTTQ